jgi:hypothetical protein
MKPSDVYNIKVAYDRVLKEDIGAGADTGGAIVMGVNMPDVTPESNDYEDDAKNMAKAQLLGMLNEVKDILNELNNKELEPWMASKIATVSDRIHSVHQWMEYQE